MCLIYSQFAFNSKHVIHAYQTYIILSHNYVCQVIGMLGNINKMYTTYMHVFIINSSHEIAIIPAHRRSEFGGIMNRERTSKLYGVYWCLTCRNFWSAR